MEQPNPEFILIVDDNPDNLSVLSQTLKSAGYAVRVAIDGEDALQQVARSLPALILLDVMMPGIDGFETCRQLKENPDMLAVPILFMTALADDENKVKGLSIGAVDYITKPFNEAEVLARVRVHLKITNLLTTLQIQNQRLKQEVTQRQRAEQALHTLNKDLEARVDQRTEQLSQSLDELKGAQLALVQQEKLSALGSLVAGVAHEINNPMSCIANNIQFVSSYGQQLLAHISLYQQDCPHPGEAVLDHAEDIDLDYLKQDFPNLIESMAVSSDRIKAISRSLRTFARSDAQQKVPFNLHEGLESTLLILKHRLQSQNESDAVKLIKTYGTLPDVFCYPGKLNQVFMNILANALDAFEEHQIQSPTITICTERQNKHVLISITDNAGGMTEEVRSQIFDQAYTTKPVGKGTGLGLSIVHQIVVEEHGGAIECHSMYQEGSEFQILIPIGVSL